MSRMDLTDPWGERLSRSALAAREEPRAARTVAWLVPALAMALVGGVFLTRPALWTDELATWGMTTTSWADMWPVLRYVDAVLAPYYVLMRAWAEVAGTSDLALRLPSLAAMVGAAALTGRLGSRLVGPRTGLLAGLLLVAFPSATRFAQEARPYALTVFAAVLATLLLVRLVDRPTLPRTLAYALALALLGMLHLIGLLLLVAHGWSVLAWRREALWHWLLGAALGALPAVPLIWFGSAQRSQVAYIPGLSDATFGSYGTVLFGTLAVGLLVIALSLFSLPLRHPAAVYTAWAVLPPFALAAASIWLPLFLPRYLIFTLPAWALLAGVALSRVRPALAVTALAGVLALGATAHVGLRQVDGHDEATRVVADILTERVTPGDAAVYAAAEPDGGWTTRDLVEHYVPADRRPTDPLLARPPRTDGVLLAGECAEVSRCLGKPGRVWVVRLRELDDPVQGLGAEKEKVLRSGYRTEQVWRPTGLTLALMVRNR
ncbi:glycosyltransferase family 39 protein [Micromonospora siamensis]|uniref:glycosyltransferase family 39 protein n=1 Tax=Micromonospora siamensis TaxID=299152 RepID=UPI00156149BE